MDTHVGPTAARLLAAAARRGADAIVEPPKRQKRQKRQKDSSLATAQRASSPSFCVRDSDAGIASYAAREAQVERSNWLAAGAPGGLFLDRAVRSAHLVLFDGEIGRAHV